MKALVLASLLIAFQDTPKNTSEDISENISEKPGIYKTVDENGNIIYTDTPPDEEAKAIDLLPVNVTPAVKTLPTRIKKRKEFKYQQLIINSPKNDETINGNVNPLNIRLNLFPSVNTRLKHKLQILINGQVVSEGTQTSFSQDKPDRGTSTITAQVIDEQGKVLISATPVIVHIKRFSRLNKP